MSNKFTLQQFLKKYSNDRACLKEIVNIRWPDGILCPKCQFITPHYQLRTRPVFSCKVCKHQTYPLKGTIFQHSTTPLKLWFYAMFVMIKTKSGISAKQLQREIGVSYETAWRMFHQIRKLMADDGSILTGEVEIDETWIGGKGYFRGKKWWANWQDIPKTIVMGMTERGGRVRTFVIEDTNRWTLTWKIKQNIDQNAWVLTDGHQGYRYLDRDGYRHDYVNHMTHYVDSFNSEIHTNTIEGFWSQLKRGLTGVYRHVDPKYLQNYCNEYAFRYSYRGKEDEIFNILLSQITKKTTKSGGLNRLV